MAYPYDDTEDQPRSRRISAVELRRRANPSRRPSYDQRGNIRGFRSVPGATPSYQDAAPSGAPLIRSLPTADQATGFTDSGAWDRFFHKRDFATKPTTPTPAPSPASNAFATAGGFFPSLAPTTPPDAASMASTMSRPYAAPRVSADSLYRDAAKSHLAYVNGQIGPAPVLPSGAEVAFKSGPVMKINTPYGTGSVRPIALAQKDPKSPLYVPKHEQAWQDLMNDNG